MENDKESETDSKEPDQASTGLSELEPVLLPSSAGRCCRRPMRVPYWTSVSRLAWQFSRRSSSHSTVPFAAIKTQVLPPKAKYPSSSPLLMV